MTPSSLDPRTRTEAVPTQARANGLDIPRLRAALLRANLPALVNTTFQLTGDRRWLRDPFRPTRPRGLEDHDDGGLAPETQLVIRAGAEAAIIAWAGGLAPAVRAPDETMLTELMSQCMGEHVPAEYAPMVAREMGFGDERDALADVVTDGARVIVIGAGVSGLLAADRLRCAGMTVTVLEKNDDVGGTWLENRYPGCGVDTPSHLYEVSYVPRAWSAHFADRDEIEQYMCEIADALDVRGLIRFGATVHAARYDEAPRAWTVTYETADGGRHQETADYVVTAVGQLNRPKLPAFDGLEAFTGVLCHSARWPDGLDISDRRVAVIGSGATAMQLVPQLAQTAAHVDVYQRSPGWVTTNDKYFAAVDDDARWLMDSVPFYRGWLRFRLAWAFNDKVHPTLLRDPAWPHPERSVNAVNDVYRRFFTGYLHEQLADRPDLVEKCLPDYPPFGKRILIDNGWFAALKQPHVELVTDGIERITPAGIRTANGTERDVDVIVCATGFDAMRPLAGIDVRGRAGRRLNDEWGDDPRAYLGMSAPGYPNLFFLYGPNTNLGHGGSYPVIAECQVRYLSSLLRAAAAAGAAAVEVKREVHDDYNRELDSAHAELIWTHPGMRTWYRNSRGRVVANFPWRVVDYWAMTRTADLADFDIEEVGA